MLSLAPSPHRSTAQNSSSSAAETHRGAGRFGADCGSGGRHRRHRRVPNILRAGLAGARSGSRRRLRHYERPRSCRRWCCGMDQSEKTSTATRGITRNQGVPATTITMARRDATRRLPLASQTSTPVSRRARRRSTLGGNPFSLRHHGFALTTTYCPWQCELEPNVASPPKVVRRERRRSRSEVPISRAGPTGAASLPRGGPAR